MHIQILPLIAATLLLAGPALAQGSASVGRSAGVVHGQSWNAGQQDTSGFNTGGGGTPTTRTQALRQRSAAARAAAPARQAATTTQRRRGAATAVN